MVLPSELIGVYLNPDEIESAIRIQGFLDLEEFGLVVNDDSDQRVLTFFQQSPLLNSAGFSSEAANVNSTGGRVHFSQTIVNSYFASVMADFLRQQLLKQKTSFTFETVMSSPDKVELLRQARFLGYRTYLYYIATDDPQINISRIRNRIEQGGHSVPEDKIRSRYYRSLDLLVEAIQQTNRAFIFDNSSHKQKHTWLAEITDGYTLEIRSDKIHEWFRKAVLEKFPPTPGVE